jgi:tetratricopeptide (TPR) repeat protein
MKLFKEALQKYANQSDTKGMLRCMLSLGDTYRMTGDFRLASRNYSQAIELAKKHRESIWVADARIGLGLSLRALGRWKDALKLIRESAQIYRRTDDLEGLAFSLWAEAGALRIQGKITESIKTFKKSFAIFKNLRNEQGTGYCLCGLGGTHRIAGLIKDSLQYYNEANTLFSCIKDRFGIAYSYCGIGNAYRMMKDYKKSIINFSKAVDLYQKIGDKVSYAYTLWSLGTTYKMEENFQEARDNFIKAMLLFRRTKDPRGIVYCNLGLGELDLLSERKVNAINRIRMAFDDAVKNSFAIEKCHAALLLSYINKNNLPSPPLSKGEQGKFSEKINNKCYNRLGLKLKFQGLPFNIP